MTEYASKQAPCGFGAFGTCCCTCVNQLKLLDQCTHTGGTRKCGDQRNDDFICIAFINEGIAMKNDKHGMCEVYEERK